MKNTLIGPDRDLLAVSSIPGPGSSTTESDLALGGLCSLSAIVGPLEGFVKLLTSLHVVESEYFSQTLEVCLYVDLIVCLVI